MPATANAGPARDYVGYGRNAPFVAWPDGVKLAINLVLNYEEGAEYSWAEDDGRNDNWGEYNIRQQPARCAISAPKPISNMAAAQGCGVWRGCSTATIFRSPFRPAPWRWSAIPAVIALDECKAATTCWAMACAGANIPPWRATKRSASFTQPSHSTRSCRAQRPAGWNCRSFPSVNTRDLIVGEGGFLYYSDPCNDDLPYFVDHDGHVAARRALFEDAERQPLSDRAGLQQSARFCRGLPLGHRLYVWRGRRNRRAHADHRRACPLDGPAQSRLGPARRSSSMSARRRAPPSCAARTLRAIGSTIMQL